MYIKDDKYRYNGISDEHLGNILLSRDEEILLLQTMIRKLQEDLNVHIDIVKQHQRMKAMQEANLALIKSYHNKQER